MSQCGATRSIERSIDRVQQLHSAPQVVMQLLKLTKEVDFDLYEVVDCLESDPALATKLLRVVNSSHSGLKYKITSLRQAVNYLGQRSLRLLAMSFSLLESLTRGPGGKLFSEYWNRALAMAAAASRLTHSTGDVASDEAYVAGLLADLGTLALVQLEGEAYVELYQATVHGPELVALEREQFGFGHPEIGARLLARWDLSADLVQAVEQHHQTGPAETKLGNLVRAADLMADALWTPNSPRVGATQRFLQEQFGLDVDGFIALAVASKDDLARDAEAFEIRLPDSIDCQALMDQARQLHLSAALDTAIELDSIESALGDYSA